MIFVLLVCIHSFCVLFFSTLTTQKSHLYFNESLFFEMLLYFGVCGWESCDERGMTASWRL